MAEKMSNRFITIKGKIIAYIVSGNTVTPRPGKLVGNKIVVDKEVYYVDPAHLFLVERKSGLLFKKKYYVMAVYLDPIRKMSQAPPVNMSKPWTEDEIKAAIYTRATITYQEMLKEEREKMLKIVQRSQLISLAIVVVSFITMAIVYWYVTGQLVGKLGEMLQKMFPPVK